MDRLTENVIEWITDSKVAHLYHCLCNGSFLCEMEDLPLPDKELMDWWRETYRGNQN